MSVYHSSDLKSPTASRRYALLAGAAVAALLPAPAVFAQDAAPSTAERAGVPEIIVTANRRAERAQDVPIAITALSRQRLEQQGIAREQDLQASVPSLTVGPNGQGSRDSQSFTIRGQGATFQASPGVVVYLNEVPLPSALTLSQQGGPGNFVDIENLQVLSGPQGTLFGRNTTGGAVLIVPKKPTNDFGGWIKGEYGNYDRKVVEGAVNIPVMEDKLMFRVSGAFHDRDGYTYDVIHDKDRDNEHWYSGRLGILFKPTERIENYTMLYGAKSDNNGTGLVHRGFNVAGLAGVGLCDTPTTGPCSAYNAITDQANALGPRRTALSTDVFSQTETWGVSNTTDIELGDELTLRNIVSYSRMRLRYRYDSDATPLQQHDVDPGALPTSPVFIPGVGTVTYGNDTSSREGPRDNFRVWTEELQLQGNMLDDKLTWTIGGFYFDQRPAGTQTSNALLYCPAAYTGNAVACQSSTAFYGTKTVSKALYAQGTLDFGALSPSLDGLRLTAGYRHTWDDVSGFATQYNRSPLLPPGTVTCGRDNLPTSEATAYNDCLFSGGQKTNSPSWLIGLDYKITPTIMIYGKVSRGYKAGGFNPYAVFFGLNGDPDTRSFGPETVTSYEAGFKADFRVADVPVRLNTSVYTLDYNDIQRATGDFNLTTGAGGARTLNADARIRGVEVEASIRPFDGVEIGGNFSYTDAKYKRYQYQVGAATTACNGAVPAGGIADSTCLPFQYVAPYIWSIHASADQSLGDDMGTLSLFVNFSYTSSQPTEAVQLEQNQPGSRLEAFGVLNASLDWRSVGGSNFDLGVFGTNLTNNLYRISNSNVYQNGGLLYWSTIYGEPRMYGLRLRYHFGGE